MLRLTWKATSTFKQSLSLPVTIRYMSTATLHSFMVFAPDYVDEGAPARRQKVRERHLVGIKGLHESGALKIGGVLLSPESIETPDATRKMIGSMIVVRAENLAEVRKKIESDIYWTEGVWDKERLVILPFAQATFT